MHLYLIRHGEAAGGTTSDFERRLTPRGLESARGMAERITSTGPKARLLFTSPLTRARQTAEVFGAAWALEAAVAEWLQPGTPPSDILARLEELRREQPAVEAMALVGHMPTLGLVIGALTEGLPAREVSLATGAAALLVADSFEAGGARLEWLISPDTR